MPYDFTECIYPNEFKMQDVAPKIIINSADQHRPNYWNMSSKKQVLLRWNYFAIAGYVLFLIYSFMTLYNLS